MSQDLTLTNAAGRDMKDQKQTEETLRKNEARYRSIFEQSPIGISITTREGQLLEANAALTRILGYDLDELRRLDVSQTYNNPEDRIVVIEAIRRTGRISNYPVFMKRKDGFVVDALLTVSLVHDGDTELLLTSFIDVTEQKRMKKVFLESEERYRIAVEDSYDGIAIIKDNVVTYANKKLLEIFGYDTLEDIIGKNPGVVAHPDDREMLSRNSIDRQHGKKVPPKYEFKGIRKDGTTIYIEISVSSTLLHGELVSFAFMRDITERKRMQEALLESEERYRIAIEYSNDGVAIVRENEHLYVNHKYVDIFGYNAPEDLIGKEMSLIICPDDHERIEGYIRDRKLGKYAPTQYEFKGIKKDGTTIYVEVAVNAIVYNMERVSLAFLRDISERKENEALIKHYQEFLETLSTTDGLTGIGNRRRFDEVLELEWHRSVRNSTSLSLIMMDIDFFKAFNDHYGHIAGDDCLRKIAVCLAGSLQRATDLTARYGGEEFACILSDTDAEGALFVANNIKKNVHNLNVLHAYSSAADRITLSMGVATLIPKRNQMPLGLTKLADDLLYEAKHNGRNQIKNNQEEANDGKAFYTE